jgi:Tol biopolymer transport system component
MYEGTSNHRIFFSKVEDGRWTTPDVVEFTRQQHGANPVFSPDEKRLYFHSCRPKPFHERFDNMSIWYVERAGAGWGEPVKLGAPINSGHSDGGPYLLADGTMYFSSNRPGGNGENDIYRSRFVNGRFAEPEHLDDSINTKDTEYSPCVAPDESYIVFSRYVEQPKGVRLFVSFRRPDGSWTPAVSMGEKIELCKKARIPGLSPDGKHLFFCAYQNRDVEVYWVDAAVIDLFRPGAPD